MFTIDNTFIDFESGEEAVKILFEELGQDFINSYKKIRNLVMEKRIGQDYLLSRKVTCSHPTFMEKYPNVDNDTFCLLTTDLVIRGEAILFMLKKQTGIDVMRRYKEIKKSIYKRELKRKKLYNENRRRERSNLIMNVCTNVTKKADEIALYYFVPFVESSVTKIVMVLIRGIKYLYTMIFRRYLN